MKSSDVTLNSVANVAPNSGLINELERFARLMNNANIVPSMFFGMILAYITRVGITTRA